MADTKKAPGPPAPQQRPGLPGLTVEELKGLLGDKEVLILQMTKLVNSVKEQNAALAKALLERDEEIAKLKGKGKKPAK